jgi:hypothetical protein
MTNAGVDSVRNRIRRLYGDAVADAHGHSIRHRAEIEASRSCGCFYCLRIYPREQIADWIRDEGTALCPHCGIDSVIGDASGYEVSEPFLTEMHKAWFSGLSGP